MDDRILSGFIHQGIQVGISVGSEQCWWKGMESCSGGWISWVAVEHSGAQQGDCVALWLSFHICEVTLSLRRLSVTRTVPAALRAAPALLSWHTTHGFAQGSWQELDLDLDHCQVQAVRSGLALKQRSSVCPWLGRAGKGMGSRARDSVLIWGSEN